MFWITGNEEWTVKPWLSLSFPVGHSRRFGLVMFGRRFFLGCFYRLSR